MTETIRQIPRTVTTLGGTESIEGQDGTGSFQAPVSAVTASVSSSLTSLSSSVSQHSTSLSQLSSSLSNTNSSVVSVTSSLSSTQSGLVSVTSSLSSTQSEVTAVSSSLSSLAIAKGYSYLSSAASTTNAGWQKVPIEHNSYDTAGIWDNSNHRFTPTTAGYYLCSMRVRLNAAPAFPIETAIGLNGSQNIAVGGNAVVISSLGTVQGIGGTALVHCNGSTDYIEAWMFAGTAAALTTGLIDTWLQILGPF